MVYLSFIYAIIINSIIHSILHIVVVQIELQMDDLNLTVKLCTDQLAQVVDVVQADCVANRGDPPPDAPYAPAAVGPAAAPPELPLASPALPMLPARGVG
jgi:hypothetical protein